MTRQLGVVRRIDSGLGRLAGMQQEVEKGGKGKGSSSISGFSRSTSGPAQSGDPCRAASPTAQPQNRVAGCFECSLPELLDFLLSDSDRPTTDNDFILRDGTTKTERRALHGAARAFERGELGRFDAQFEKKIASISVFTSSSVWVRAIAISFTIRPRAVSSMRRSPNESCLLALRRYRSRSTSATS